MTEQRNGHALSPGLGLLLAVVGGGALALALMKDRNATQMLPGMDGCLTAGVLAAVLPLSHGLNYRVALVLMLPVVLMQLAACRAAGAAFLPILGPELLVVGVLGMVPLPWRSVAGPPRSAARPETRRDRPGQMVTGTAS